MPSTTQTQYGKNQQQLPFDKTEWAYRCAAIESLTEHGTGLTRGQLRCVRRLLKHIFKHRRSSYDGTMTFVRVESPSAGTISLSADLEISKRTLERWLQWAAGAGLIDLAVDCPHTKRTTLTINWHRILAGASSRAGSSADTSRRLDDQPPPEADARPRPDRRHSEPDRSSGAFPSPPQAAGASRGFFEPAETGASAARLRIGPGPPRDGPDQSATVSGPMCHGVTTKVPRCHDQSATVALSIRPKEPKEPPPPMRAPARGDPERTAAAEIFCSGPEPGFKPTGASPGFVGTASATPPQPRLAPAAGASSSGLPPPASSLLPQLRRAGVERIDPVARDCLQAGLSADELGELVDTYLANLALRKFDGPGALVDRIRNGTWPVPGVVDAAELQRQRRERNQRLQHAQRQTAIRYEFARVRKRLHQPGHYLHQYDAAAIAELQRDHGYTEAEIEEALA